jgi:hypothetical protein
MPLPKPTNGETRKDFVSRCMGSQASDEMQGTNDQKVAACERQYDEAKAAGGELELKSLGPLEVKDAEQGAVEAVVATLGKVDRDGDVILPGALPAGGAKVKLSGYGHDVVLSRTAPVGKGLILEEGDRLVFKGRFFMTTERGREAFHTVKELGADSEWSFGFPPQVKTGALTPEMKAAGARRAIAGFSPVEASPVLVGAGFGTGTVSVKDGEEKDLPKDSPKDPGAKPTEEEIRAFQRNQTELLRL